MVANINGKGQNAGLEAGSAPATSWLALVWSAVAQTRGLKYVALACIMAVAVALRVAWPGVAEFKIDEVQPLALAEQIWLDHHLPLVRGLTSVGCPGRRSSVTTWPCHGPCLPI